MPSAAAEIERWWPDVDALALRDAVTSGPIALAAPGTFADHAPVHLLTTEAGAAGFVEHGWVGRRVRVGGEVVLRVTDPSPRCVVPTLPQGGFSPDPGLLRAVVAHGRAPIPALGRHVFSGAEAYAVVEQGGTVRRGDRVAVDRDG